MSIVEDINVFVNNVSIDESVTSLLSKAMDDQLRQQSFPRKYYFLTELVNPTQAYWSRKYPDLEKSKALMRRLALGNQLQRFASYWFKTLPEFDVEEGKVDGSWVGVDGVRGSIDYRFGESILELKTKDELPDNPQEIISIYPHDLEQLAFYSAIHPLGLKNNYLVFMENSPPYNFRAFNVITKDPGRLKEIIKNRIKKLTAALENDDPSELGKCRYHGKGCQYTDLCNCNEYEMIPTEAIEKSVDIKFDNAFTQRLEDAKEACKASESSRFTTFEIINPRKVLKEKVYGLDSPFTVDPLKDGYKACLYFTMKRLPIGLSDAEIKDVKKSQREDRVHIGFRWAKMKRSGTEDGEIVPYLQKISGISDHNYARRPGSYNLAELGIACATYGKNTGYIFTVFPEIDKLCRVWRVTFSDFNGILKLVRETIDNIEKAEKKEDIHALPQCQSFMCGPKACNLWEVCNSEPVSAT